jgi:hypothetical protein
MFPIFKSKMLIAAPADIPDLLSFVIPALNGWAYVP